MEHTGITWHHRSHAVPCLCTCASSRFSGFLAARKQSGQLYVLLLFLNPIGVKYGLRLERAFNPERQTGIALSKACGTIFGGSH